MGPASLSCNPPLVCGNSSGEGCINPSIPPPNMPPRALGVPGGGVCMGGTFPLPANWSKLSEVGMAILVGVAAGVARVGPPICMPCTGISAGVLPDCRIYSGCCELRSYTACKRGVGMATECVGVLMGGGAGEDVGVAVYAAPPPFSDDSTV